MKEFLKCIKCNKKMHEFLTMIMINDTDIITHYCKNEKCEYGIGYEIKDGKPYPKIFEKFKDKTLIDLKPL